MSPWTWLDQYKTSLLRPHVDFTHTSFRVRPSVSFGTMCGIAYSTPRYTKPRNFEALRSIWDFSLVGQKLSRLQT